MLLIIGIIIVIVITITIIPIVIIAMTIMTIRTGIIVIPQTLNLNNSSNKT